MIKTCRIWVLVLSCLILISCAGSQSPRVEKEAVVKPSPSSENLTYIQLDAAIEEDFIDAVERMENSDYASAIEKLKSVIDREKRLIAPYINIAIAYRKTGEVEEAEKNLVMALRMDPVHPVANNELGLMYRKEGKFDEARAAYELVRENHPEFTAAMINLGVLCDLYMHDFECALEQFERYLEINPDDKNVFVWVADVKRRVK
ncbi:MAG: tetratricopeptide repeat protein [Gammaproteobacteria bacterium]|nr:tetratricopeptide repeat protein [Gammaproteobacteria bacterium]